MVSFFTLYNTSNSSGLPDRNGAIGHAEVGGNGLLTADASGSLSLRTRHAREDAHVQHTGDLLDSARQSIDLPNTALSAAVLSSGNIALREQRLERGVDDEKALVGLERTRLGKLRRGPRRHPNNGVDAAQFLEGGEDAVSGDGSDFNGDIFPVGEETGLELARVCHSVSMLVSRVRCSK